MLHTLTLQVRPSRRRYPLVSFPLHLHVLSLDREIARRYGIGRGGRYSGEQKRDFVRLQGREGNKNTVLYLLASILLQPRDAVG